MKGYKIFFIVILVIILILVLLYNIFKNKPLFCTDSKVIFNFVSPINDIYHVNNLIVNPSPNIFDQTNMTNSEIGLFYTRFIIKMECDPDFEYRPLMSKLGIEKIIFNPNNNDCGTYRKIR